MLGASVGCGHCWVRTRDAERKAELLKVLEAEKARAPPSFAELLRLENCEARMTSLVPPISLPPLLRLKEPDLDKHFVPPEDCDQLSPEVVKSIRRRASFSISSEDDMAAEELRRQRPVLEVGEHKIQHELLALRHTLHKLGRQRRAVTDSDCALRCATRKTGVEGSRCEHEMERGKRM